MGAAALRGRAPDHAAKRLSGHLAARLALFGDVVRTPVAGAATGRVRSAGHSAAPRRMDDRAIFRHRSERRWMRWTGGYDGAGEAFGDDDT